MTEEELEQTDDEALLSLYVGKHKERVKDYDLIEVIKNELIRRCNHVELLKKEEKRLEFLWDNPSWTPKMDDSWNFRQVIDNAIWEKEHNG